MSDTTTVVSDERAATAPQAKALAWAVTLVAAAMSLYHMYVAAFGPPEAMIFRGTHLLFALTLVFLLYPLAPRRSWWWRLADAALLAAGWAMVLHIFINYEYFINRIIYIDDLTTWDKVYAVAGVLVVLEGTRRVIGWALPITAMLFLGYALFNSDADEGALQAGGIIGSTARTLAGLAFPAPHGGFPRATLAVNLVGSLVLGFYLKPVEELHLPDGLTGFLKCNL